MKINKLLGFFLLAIIVGALSPSLVITKFTTGFILNKGLFTNEQLSMFDSVQNAEGKMYSRPAVINIDSWFRLYKDLYHALMKTHFKKN